MNLKDFFSRGNPPSRPFRPSAHCVLAAHKAIDTLALTDDAYNLNALPTRDNYRGKLRGDVTVLLHFDNLRKIALEIITADRTILAEQVIHFGYDGRMEGGRGTLMPVLPKHLIAAHRLTVHHRSSDHSAYREHLQFKWTACEVLARQPGDTVEGNQARKTGGRQRDEVFVSAALRERIIITSVGDKYGFCDVPARGLTGVFLYREHVEGNRRPRVGEHWTGQLMQLPVGFQIRAARRQSA